MLDDKWVEIIRKNKKDQKMRARIRRSRLMWILDASPYETHMLFLRSVDEQRARDHVRHTYSWHNLSRLQSESAFKAGLVGIVTAPILAGLSNYEGLPIALQFPNQMGLIFLSGLFYVLATTLCNLRVPFFVQLYLLDDERRRYRAIPFQEISTAIVKEFSNLASTIEITPEDFIHLHPNEKEVVAVGFPQGHRFYKTGFLPPALAYIDKLFHKLSSKYEFQLLERDGERLRSKYGPGVIYGSPLYIRQLDLASAQDHHLNSDNSLNLTSNDVIVTSMDASLRLEATQPGSLAESHVYGLDRIIREEYLDLYVEELSYWQSWQRPFSRVFVLWMYRLSLISFSCFLTYQAFVVWNAIDFSHLFTGAGHISDTTKLEQ